MTTEPNTITFHNSNADWVMRITADRRIEVNEDVKVTEAAQKVLDAVQYLLKAQPAPQFKAVSDPRLMEHQFTVQQILEAFPLVADEGLDQEKHCCEWALQQDRKRLHAMLATPPLPAQEPVALLLQLRSALALASAICDAVPNRESSHLGTLVNSQPDGSHGYRQIQEAEAALVKYLETLAVTPVLPVQPEQEPVAVVDMHEFATFSLLQNLPKGKHTLYTTPPLRPWVDLTEEEILACDPSEECWGLIEIARTLEAKLREKNST